MQLKVAETRSEGMYKNRKGVHTYEILLQAEKKGYRYLVCTF